MKPRRWRGYAFRTVSQLAIGYRTSQLSENGPKRSRRGPKAGDRLPDAPIVHDGQKITLHTATARPGWHLLLCGPTSAWPARVLGQVSERHADLITVHYLSTTDEPGTLRDPDGRAHRRLGLAADDTALYLVRPDGHIGYRSGGVDLTGLHGYLNRWLPGASRPAG
jgi:hypothetical protein